MRRVLEDEPLAHTHYAEVVDAHTLRAPDTLHGEVRLLVAAEVGGIRLIDNDGTVLGDRARSGAAGRPAEGSGPVPAGDTAETRTRTKEREPCGAA
jgi:pantoate-beta-alanine ligase